MAISLTLFTSNARQGHILCMRLRQLWSASLPNWRGLFKHRRIQQSTCPTLPKHVSTKPRELNIHPLNPWEICFFKSSRSKNLTKMRISEKDGCFFYVAFPPENWRCTAIFLLQKKNWWQINRQVEANDCLETCQVSLPTHHVSRIDRDQKPSVHFQRGETRQQWRSNFVYHGCWQPAKKHGTFVHVSNWNKEN